MAIEQFEQWVRQSFGYLFTEYRFDVVSRRVRPGQPQQRLELVLQAADCLIFAYDDDEEANVLLGPRSAPLKAVGQDNGQWFYIRQVIDFFERGPITEQVQQCLAPSTFTPHNERLARLGVRFRPYCAAALALFHADTFPRKQEELIAYDESRFKEFREELNRVQKK